MIKAIALLGPESTPYGVSEDLPCEIQRRVDSDWARLKRMTGDQVTAAG